MPKKYAPERAREDDHVTLAQMVYRYSDPEMRRQLEAFRLSYEAKFGETDLTQRFTSTWPTDQQQWMVDNYPKRYFEGLPPFVQAFIKEQMMEAHRDGLLDDMPDHLLKLYLDGQMEVDGRGWSR